MSQERRKSTRIDTQQIECQVSLGNSTSSAVVNDESIDGMRVGNLDLLVLMTNQPMVVKYDNQSFTGCCRHISRSENGLYDVGLYREVEALQPSGESVSILLNSFMRFSDCDIVCIPLHWIDEDRLRVRLLDGNEFNVGRNKVFSLTRFEREQSLQDADTLQQLIQIYETMVPGGGGCSNAQDVVRLEFGPPTPALATA